MKLQEAINHADALKPNFLKQGFKRDLVSRCDNEIFETVMKHREDCPIEEFVPYTDDDFEKELLVPAPYDDVYELYIMAQIDYYNGETDKYNNSMEMYNARLDSFYAYWAKGHRQKVCYNFEY